METLCPAAAGFIDAGCCVQMDRIYRQDGVMQQPLI